MIAPLEPIRTLVSSWQLLSGERALATNTNASLTARPRQVLYLGRARVYHSLFRNWFCDAQQVICSLARAMLKRGANQRFGVNKIKNHPFFYGCGWENLRYIAPPFVPALSSITDTTYFPTDELGNVPDQLEAVKQVGSDKDLVFLG